MNPLTQWSFPILLSARSGLRSGEAYGLVWGDIAFDVKGKDGKLRTFIKLKHTFNWKTKTLTPTKSGHERIIDITALRDYLLERKGTQTEKDWVFKRDNRWEKGRAAHAFRAAIESVGYKTEKVMKGGKEVELKPNFHSLRVGYIMSALAAGLPHLVTMSQVGHRDFATLKRYINKLAEQDLEIHDSSIKIEEFIKRTARKKVG
jgi:integrase